MYWFFFFFSSRRRHTRCGRDWSSDVCSSDLDASGYPASSHDGKALLNVLETFPRDELFQIEPDRLYQWCEGILDLETRPRLRVFARADKFDRFVSVFVYAPRDRYSSSVRERIGAILAE